LGEDEPVIFPLQKSLGIFFSDQGTIGIVWLTDSRGVDWRTRRGKRRRRSACETHRETLERGFDSSSEERTRDEREYPYSIDSASEEKKTKVRKRNRRGGELEENEREEERNALDTSRREA